MTRSFSRLGSSALVLAFTGSGALPASKSMARLGLAAPLSGPSRPGPFLSVSQAVSLGFSISSRSLMHANLAVLALRCAHLGFFPALRSFACAELPPFVPRFADLGPSVLPQNLAKTDPAAFAPGSSRPELLVFVPDGASTESPLLPRSPAHLELAASVSTASRIGFLMFSRSPQCLGPAVPVCGALRTGLLAPLLGVGTSDLTTLLRSFS